MKLNGFNNGIDSSSGVGGGPSAVEFSVMRNRSAYSQLSTFKNADGTITSNGLITRNREKLFIQKVWYTPHDFKVVAIFKFKKS